MTSCYKLQPDIVFLFWFDPPYFSLMILYTSTIKLIASLNKSIEMRKVESKQYTAQDNNNVLIKDFLYKIF